jgi:hypothetical protein
VTQGAGFIDRKTHWRAFKRRKAEVQHLGFSLFRRRHILGGMDPPSIEEIVIASLRLSPASIGELCFFLPKLKPLDIRLAVKALRREGQIVQIEGRDDEGRPVYCLAGYLEASGWIDHSDLILARDYGSSYSRPDEADL